MRIWKAHHAMSHAELTSEFKAIKEVRNMGPFVGGLVGSAVILSIFDY